MSHIHSIRYSMNGEMSSAITIRDSDNHIMTESDMSSSISDDPASDRDSAIRSESRESSVGRKRPPSNPN